MVTLSKFRKEQMEAYARSNKKTLNQAVDYLLIMGMVAESNKRNAKCKKS